MSDATSKVWSLTRPELRQLHPEYIGRTVVESRQRYTAETGIEPNLSTQHSLFAYEKPYRVSMFDVASPDIHGWGWCDLPPLGGMGTSWIVAITDATTPTSLWRLHGWLERQASDADLPTAQPTNWLAERQTPTSVTTPDQEYELNVQPEPKRVRKLTAKIVRRSQGMPNPILE